MQTTMQFQYPLTLTQTEFLCQVVPAAYNEERRIWRGRPKQRETHIPRLQNQLAHYHKVVLEACTEVPVLLSKLKALHRLEMDEGEAKNQRDNGVKDNAISRQRESIFRAENTDRARAAQRRCYYDVDIGAGGADEVELGAGGADEVELGAVGGIEDQGDAAMSAAEDANEPSLDDLLENQPDFATRYKVARQWYDENPDEPGILSKLAVLREMAEDERNARRRKENTEKRTHVKKEVTPEAVLERQLKKDPDVKAFKKALARDTKNTVVLTDMDEKHFDPATIIPLASIPEPNVDMQLDDDAPPAAKEALSRLVMDQEESNRKFQEEEKERKRKHNSEQRQKKLEGLLEIEKRKSMPPPAQDPPPPSPAKKVFGLTLPF